MWGGGHREVLPRRRWEEGGQDCKTEEDPRSRVLPVVSAPEAPQRRLELGDRTQCPSVPWERS